MMAEQSGAERRISGVPRQTQRRTTNAGSIRWEDEAAIRRLMQVMQDGQNSKDVPLIGVFVNDQEAALDFYTGKLGLELIQDEAYGPDARWITVAPAETGIRIVLKKAEKDHEKAMVGNSDGAPVLTLGTDDLRAAHERLKDRGVRFLGESYHYPWGTGALLLDQDGSPILLQQEDSDER